MTEYGYSAFAGQAEVDLPGALLNAEIAAEFLTLGGKTAYLYGYEPNTLIKEMDTCDTWGNLALFLENSAGNIRCPLPCYYAAQTFVAGMGRTRQRRKRNFPRRPAIIKNAHGRTDSHGVCAASSRRAMGRFCCSTKTRNKPAKSASNFAMARKAAVFAEKWNKCSIHRSNTSGRPMAKTGIRTRNNAPHAQNMERRDLSAITLPAYSLTVLRGELGAHRAEMQQGHRISPANCPAVKICEKFDIDITGCFPVYWFATTVGLRPNPTSSGQDIRLISGWREKPLTKIYESMSKYCAGRERPASATCAS